VAEGLAGIEAIAAGRVSASPLVRDIVSAIYLEDEAYAPPSAGILGGASGVGRALAACRVAAAFLEQAVPRAEADAYRHWLESIAARVCQTSRATMFRIAGAPADTRFLGELAAALNR